jgi:GTP cyclohydrolase I
MAYHKVEKYDEDVTQKLIGHYHEVIKQLGENPQRDGLLRPRKGGQSHAIPDQRIPGGWCIIMKSAMFEESYSEHGHCKGYRNLFICEHHMLPFIGKAHIAISRRER